MKPEEYFSLRRDREFDAIIRRAMQQDNVSALKRAEDRYGAFL